MFRKQMRRVSAENSVDDDEQGSQDQDAAALPLRADPIRKRIGQDTTERLTPAYPVSLKCHLTLTSVAHSATTCTQASIPLR